MSITQLTRFKLNAGVPLEEVRTSDKQLKAIWERHGATYVALNRFYTGSSSTSSPPTARTSIRSSGSGG